MRVFSFAKKDTFITNVIVANTFRAIDANVGQAGTLDLFKLHEESNIAGSASSDIQEVSRILIKFDLDVFRSLTGSLLTGTKLSSAKFALKLFDVMHGDTLPSNYNIVVYPLSKSFDEGAGIDNFAFQDLGSANYITASGQASTAVTWSLSGAGEQGYLGQENVDVITGSTFFPGTGNTNLFVTQNFDIGDEDLNVDISTIVSATIAGLIPDHGLRISFSGSEETDEKTRYIKRFYSRHSNVFSKQPRIEVHFDDTITDNVNNFLFDVTGTLFLNNVVRSRFTNIVSSSTTLTGALGDIVGKRQKWSVPILKIESGSFVTWATGAWHKLGIYSSSFSIDSLETKLTGELNSAKSATFNLVWQSADTVIPYLSSSLVIKTITRESFITPKRYRVNVTNLKAQYHTSEIAQFRVFIQEVNFSANASKLPSTIQSLVFDEIYYQIREHKSNDIIMPFDQDTKSTRMSYDSYSNYFNLYMSSFAPGKVYKLEFLIVQDGVAGVLDEKILFKVVK